MTTDDKPLVWLYGEVKTPPFSRRARLEAGFLLRRLQRGDALLMPHSRPMRSLGPRCHELRVTDETASWRIVYRIDRDAVVVVHIFIKKTRTTPESVMNICRQRFKDYDRAGR